MGRLLYALAAFRFAWTHYNNNSVSFKNFKDLYEDYELAIAGNDVYQTKH